MMKTAGSILLAAAAVGAFAAAPSAAMARPKTNSEAYWEMYLNDMYAPTYTNIDCTKDDREDNPASWMTDQDYLFVIVKGGSVGHAIYGPQVAAGTEVVAPINAGDQQSAISWLMTCQGDSSYQDYS
jgi:hypothetical protein